MDAPYDPPGFLGLIDAARILASRMYPDRWGDNVIPQDEQRIWKELKLRRNPCIIAQMLIVELPRRDKLCAERHADFVEGQQRLRDALSSGEMPAFYFDETGIQYEMISSWWRGTDAKEAIIQGLAYINADRNELALRYFVVERKGIEALPLEGITESTGVPDSEDRRAHEVTSTTSKRGRPNAYPWDEAKQFVRELIEHHGLPSPEDPELPNQAAVEARVSAFLLDKVGREPSASSVKTYVRLWLKELRLQGQK